MSTTTGRDHAEGWAVPGYVEQRELGHGASGRVVEAVQERTTLQVAIRYLSPDLVEDPDFLPRFRTQMLKLKDLDDPSVVRVYDYAEDPERPEEPEEPEGPRSPRTLRSRRSRRGPRSRRTPRTRSSLWRPRSRRTPRSRAVCGARGAGGAGGA